jgi:ATP-dependent DNA helicase RecQ
MKQPIDILKKYWGHQNFRGLQEEIIASVLEKKDTLALLPTGGGKSICFQIPALLLDGVCIVISPIISLMRDQVTALQKKGIKATTIASGATHDEIVTLFDNIKFGQYQFLYLSPERLSSALIQEKIKELQISIIAIDEAHCISEWGHDFRPSYRHISILKDIHPEAPFIALTATATQDVLKDITRNLKIKAAAVFTKSFHRENLAYQIFYLEDKLTRLLQIFKKTKKPAIVYVRTRKRTEEIAAFLNANHYKAAYYHGGMPLSEKQTTFDRWMSEEIPIMVATNAFGMGIDKANVGVVIHLELPYSIENFVQEAGRAGRDGHKAFSAVLQNANDIRSFQEQLSNSLPTISEIKEVYKKLNQYFGIALGELSDEVLRIDLQEFAHRYNFSFAKVNIILKILSNHGILEMNTKASTHATLQFLIGTSSLIRYKKQSSSIGKIIDLILRNYVGTFEQKVRIDEFTLAKKAGVTSQEVHRILQKLKQEQVIDYVASTKASPIYFLVPREDDRTINKISKQITAYLHQQQKKAAQLIQFIQNDQTCRSLQLLSYFGEPNPAACGICDVCLQKKYTPKDIENDILNFLKDSEASSIEIQEHLNADEKDILIHLRHLLSEDIIRINHYNKYYIK